MASCNSLLHVVKMPAETWHVKLKGVSNGTAMRHLAMMLQARVGSGWRLAVWAVTGHEHRL